MLLHTYDIYNKTSSTAHQSIIRGRGSYFVDITSRAGWFIRINCQGYLASNEMNGRLCIKKRKRKRRGQFHVITMELKEP
jgi:hypothetical protein